MSDASTEAERCSTRHASRRRGSRGHRTPGDAARADQPASKARRRCSTASATHIEAGDHDTRGRRADGGCRTGAARQGLRAGRATRTEALLRDETAGAGAGQRLLHAGQDRRQAGRRCEATMAELAQAHADPFPLGPGHRSPDIADSDRRAIAHRDQVDATGTMPTSARSDGAHRRTHRRYSSSAFRVRAPRCSSRCSTRIPRFVSMDERTHPADAASNGWRRRAWSIRISWTSSTQPDLAELRALVSGPKSAKVVDLAAGPDPGRQESAEHAAPADDPAPVSRRRRIILALRHPCDVILSCYMQNFRSPAFMLLCSTLERLAKSYVNAMRFWIHHQPLLRPDALTLRYEDTVSDFLAAGRPHRRFPRDRGSAAAGGFLRARHSARATSAPPATRR